MSPLYGSNPLVNQVLREVRHTSHKYDMRGTTAKRTLFKDLHQESSIVGDYECNVTTQKFPQNNKTSLPLRPVGFAAGKK